MLEIIVPFPSEEFLKYRLISKTKLQAAIHLPSAVSDISNISD